MTASARRFDSFEQALALSFEEEISKEGYFAALSEAELDSRNAVIFAKLARIDPETAPALRPMATALGLTPTDEFALRRKGRESARKRKHQTFADFMVRILRDYPAYIEEFNPLSALCPPKAKAAAKPFIDHEVAMIDMAQIYLTGSGDPHASLDTYLNRLALWPVGSPSEW